MNLLLDTCAILFLTAETQDLRAQSPGILDAADAVMVSAVSIGELACLQEKEWIQLPCHWKPWFRRVLELNEWGVIPISVDIMEEAYSLPGDFHADPADRVITATARVHRLTVLTTDRKILEYPHVDATW